jgi:hypothetical protein
MAAAVLLFFELAGAVVGFDRVVGDVPKIVIPEN